MSFLPLCVSYRDEHLPPFFYGSIDARAFLTLVQYEMYFSSPVAAVTGDIQVTITAQLGNGAVAGDWKVDMYNRATDAFDPMGADNILTDGNL